MLDDARSQLGEASSRFFPSKNRPLMSQRGSELGPFPGINGVKAPFFSFALQNPAAEPYKKYGL